MARPRFEKLQEGRRKAILEAAAREFAQVGYEAASINRILESAGLSKGGFYYYFDDKADLAATVLLWVYRDVLALYDRMNDRMRLPQDAPDFWDAIREFACQSLAMLERMPYANELGSRLGHATANDRALSQRLHEAMTRPASAMLAVWTRGQELGAVRADIPAQTLIAIFQAMKEALIRAYLPDTRVPTRAEFEHLLELQLDLIRRVAAPAGGDR